MAVKPPTPAPSLGLPRDLIMNPSNADSSDLPELTSPHQPSRSDGVETRQRLLATAIKMFAAHGYQKTSVRFLADAANCNVAAIRYYFGDKAGLYRAAVTEPLLQLNQQAEQLDHPDMPPHQALRLYYESVLMPLASGDEAREVARLHMREVLEPTGVWQHALDTAIRPRHRVVRRIVKRVLATQDDDQDIERLTFGLISLGLGFVVLRGTTDTDTETLVKNPQAVRDLAARLADDGLAMLANARQQRQ